MQFFYARKRLKCFYTPQPKLYSPKKLSTSHFLKTGLEWLPKSIYVSDRFHIEKAVIGLCGKDNTEYITKIMTAMFEFDFVKVKKEDMKY